MHQRHATSKPSKHARTLDYTKEETHRPRCDECDKIMFSSKSEARKALVGQLGSKSVRVYECPEFHGRYHVTKEWASKRNR